MTLLCEDGNSKLVEVVTVADVDSEDHVGNSLLQIWELTSGPKTKLFFSDFVAQGLVKILKLKFSKILKLELVQHFVGWIFCRGSGNRTKSFLGGLPIMLIQHFLACHMYKQDM